VSKISRMLTADQVVVELGLEPHPEGGYYAETFRSGQRVASLDRPVERDASTAIYFLLRAGEFSAFHRVDSDEVWHHYLGDALELVQLDASGARTLRLGPAIERGDRPQAVVPAGRFQAARPSEGEHGYTLCGCTVAPGFVFEDFQMPPRDELVELFPEHAAIVLAFTR